jgi:hypothetical protein
MADLKLLAWAEGDEAAAARHLEQELRCRAYTAELRDLEASLGAGAGNMPAPYHRERGSVRGSSPTRSTGSPGP